MGNKCTISYNYLINVFSPIFPIQPCALDWSAETKKSIHDADTVKVDLFIFIPNQIGYWFTAVACAML